MWTSLLYWIWFPFRLLFNIASVVCFLQLSRLHSMMRTYDTICNSNRRIISKTTIIIIITITAKKSRKLQNCVDDEKKVLFFFLLVNSKPRKFNLGVFFFGPTAKVARVHEHYGRKSRRHFTFWLFKCCSKTESWENLAFIYYGYTLLSSYFLCTLINTNISVVRIYVPIFRYICREKKICAMLIYSLCMYK